MHVVMFVHPAFDVSGVVSVSAYVCLFCVSLLCIQCKRPFCIFL